MTKRVTLVAAVAENGVIGDGSRIPWRIPGEQAEFKAVTLGHTLVMGRTTYESIGRPLPGRTTIVLTRAPGWTADGVLVAHSLPMTCIEQDAVIGRSGHINVLLLLEMITDKLASTTRALIAADPDHAVIVYGGALHNDLYPRWPLEELSYAQPLAKDGVRVLEIDLVVPEVVPHMRMVRDEPWFPLLRRASPDFLGCVQSVHFGHLEIEDDNIGGFFPHFIDSLLAGGGFTANLPGILLFQQIAQATSHKGAVVCDENSNGR